jgi:sugar (pentulose or hexulose) kinase
MSAIPVIAVFDIGKTNKKCFLIDEQYHIVLERMAQFADTRDEDGDTCEDLDALTGFIQQVSEEIFAMPQYDIRAVHCSAYGASFVHIGQDGKPVAPLYNYLKPYPQHLQDQFYQAYGGEEKFSVRTASPVLGSLNSGMQLYRLRHVQPDLFNTIQYSLHLPQYISYLFTGRYCSDITSVGSHTNLWDFRKNDYHEWVAKENILPKLPSLFACTGTMGIHYNGKPVQVGVGLHDSSAALIPYLSAFSEPFLLISTGTWCISLNPFNDTPLSSDELKQDCLCYLAYDGRPVKASRLFAGHEHEIQVARLAEKFNTATDHYKDILFDPAADTTMQDPMEASSYKEAYHILMRNIIRQQEASSSLVIGNAKRIFVDGGFANNSLYMHMLAEAFPRHEVFAASVSQATAIGAALAIHPHWNTQHVPADLISLRYYASS